ncbi:MAG: GDSL-type esterase/lipase family protein [Pirellulales bacterium]|nr:GDSL-type esterase/lipase family protein [Pirellulales bacterium]
MRFSLVIAAVGLFACQTGADQPLLEPNDRVALLGGTFVERLQTCGALEAELQCRRPDWKLSFRNLGWSGDDVHGIARKRFDTPADGFKRLLSDVETADPTVVLVIYGFSEASDGPQAMDRFAPGLRKLIDNLRKPGRRIVLIPPVALPGYKVPGYAEAIARCAEIIEQVGAQRQTPVLSIRWQPADVELTEDRLLPNEAGYAKFARLVAQPLVGGVASEASKAEIQRKIVDKNQLFFHRYRPQNETYLFLFRKHEQGNNAVEIPQFDPLIRKADQAIWALAADQN